MWNMVLYSVGRNTVWAKLRVYSASNEVERMFCTYFVPIKLSYDFA